MQSIDIIVPFVNPWDPNWLKTALKYNKNITYSSFRDSGSIRYFFRGVEKNMPWIHRVILVLQSESQIPKWLNKNNPKLKIVFHKDYIPKNLLPTFNSNVIELFYYRIKGLTKHFILANDDTIAIRNLEPEDFFIDNKIVYGRTKDYYPCLCLNEGFSHIIDNNRKAAGIITKSYKPFYTDYHLFMPELKSIHKMCFERYGREIINKMKHSHFRSNHDISHILFYFVTRKLGLCVVNDDYRLGLLNLEDRARPESLINALNSCRSKICCMNDNFVQLNDKEINKIVQETLHYFLPEKSSFEI